MNRRLIEQKITIKLEEWIETLPSELRKTTKDNILVSGGCIASMFLNEKIRDYDVYIQDMEVLYRLVNYYVKPFVNDIKVLDDRNKKEISLIDDKGIYGISLKTLHNDQIKLFFEDKDGGLEVNQDIEKENLNFTPLFFSANAITLSNDLQLIIRFNGNAEAIHKNFDYIHATNYFTFKDGLVTNNAALESLLSKRLIYQGSLYPITSIVRMRKFITRGWTITAGDIMKILFQVSQLDLTNIDVLEEQLVGVDVMYFNDLINKLREKNLELTSESFNKLIDYVFTNAKNIYSDEEQN